MGSLKDEIDLIVEIAERAERMNLVARDRVTFVMDMQHATEQFNLRLQALLEADNFNFSHDVVGIQNHINRDTGKVEDIFLPRFTDNTIE